MNKMSQFQTQSQWENDQKQDIFWEDNSSFQINPKNKKNPHLIYLIIGFVFFIALTIIFSIYNFARPIEGTWIRQADDNYGAEGMTIEVVKSGSFYEGKVTSDSNDSSKFKKGQIKWFQLKKVGFGLYECYDLCQDEENNTFSYDDIISTLTVMSGGKSLTIDSPKHSAGAHQIWIKQK